MFNLSMCALFCYDSSAVQKLQLSAERSIFFDRAPAICCLWVGRMMDNPSALKLLLDFDLAV
jgi:hypothetical protein